MTITCLPLPFLSSPPEQYVEQSLEYKTQELSNAFGSPSFYSSRMVAKDGVLYQTRSQKRIPLEGDFTEWCHENIDPKCYHCSICVADGPGPYHGPHVDPYRDYGLLYVTDTGGSSVTTSFWQKKNSPMIYPRDTEQFVSEDYSDELILIDRFVLQPNQWYLLNTRIIHSVENATSRRISLQCSLDDVADLLQKNKG